jgi:hypothetical protein
MPQGFQVAIGIAFKGGDRFTIDSGTVVIGSHLPLGLPKVLCRQEHWPVQYEVKSR